ncbi:MAG: anhydro-N-acetylmuramic acid kinase [Bacteroidota bacterium]
MKEPAVRARKKVKMVIGLMSGTSLDGVDAVIAEIKGSGMKCRFRLLAFRSYPYPTQLKGLILKNSDQKTCNLYELTRLNNLLGQFYADAVKKVVRAARKKTTDVDLIGSHGQTVCHLPEPNLMFGISVRATLQIGDPAVVAALTGIITVGDFRVADMALGGEGAPLVPYFDYLAFRSGKINRGLLNIGGIANLTVLPKKCEIDDVIAFDTGPGNMVVDGLTRFYFGQVYDKHGRYAKRGVLRADLLRSLARHPFLQRKPPKSTGREEFGNHYVREVMNLARELDPLDVLATVTDFTALAVYENYRCFVEAQTPFEELIVSGGGVRNKVLMESLQKYFGGVRVRTVDEFGLSSGAKEALCFAILANEAVSGNPANLPRVTGASRKVVLGKVCFP